MSFDLSTALIVAIVFLGAGFVKGVVAIGLPIIAVALLSQLIGIREAIYITLVPAIMTSLAQAALGPSIITCIKRLWPLLLTGCLSVVVATTLSLKGDGRLLAFIVGTLIIIYSVMSLARFKFPAPGAHEKFWTPAIGVIGGVLGGMSGMFAMPAVPYMQTLGLDREQLIQSIAIWFVAGAVVMLAVLGVNDTYNLELVILSAIATVTSLVGIWFGTMARGRMSDTMFVNVFLVAFLFMGVFIIYRALTGRH